MKSIGSRVRDIRLEKRWTQSDLAKKIKKSMNYVCRFENDEFRNPTINTIKQLADALHVGIMDLLSLSDPKACPTRNEKIIALHGALFNLRNSGKKQLNHRIFLKKVSENFYEF